MCARTAVCRGCIIVGFWYIVTLKHTLALFYENNVIMVSKINWPIITDADKKVADKTDLHWIMCAAL